MKQVRILCVCGSGTVSSAMVAGKLKELLAQKGFAVTAQETSPNGVEGELSSNHYDLIACVSPVYENYGVPKVQAVGLLTGLGEEEVIDECVKVLSAL